MTVQQPALKGKVPVSQALGKKRAGIELYGNESILGERGFAGPEFDARCLAARRREGAAHVVDVWRA